MKEPCEGCPFLPSNTYSSSARKRRLRKQAASGKVRVCHKTGPNTFGRTGLKEGEVECAGARAIRDRVTKSNQSKGASS